MQTIVVKMKARLDTPFTHEIPDSIWEGSSNEFMAKGITKVSSIGGEGHLSINALANGKFSFMWLQPDGTRVPIPHESLKDLNYIGGWEAGPY